jgi:hypothetical protein
MRGGSNWQVRGRCPAPQGSCDASFLDVNCHAGEFTKEGQFLSSMDMLVGESVARLRSSAKPWPG